MTFELLPMSFPNSIRLQALVDAARHCCACRRYKGVGVEVHHIVPVSEGGADSSDNAITLCFDCHAAAGHYNPRHPRGTKFRPEELKKHRDLWHAIVANGSVPTPTAKDVPECHVRHLLSLDNDATSELINLDHEHLPFGASFIQDNEVLKFMRRVLADDLPFTWQTSEHFTGHYWSSQYKNLSEFHAANSDFGGSTKRQLIEADFGPEGIRSEILLACYEEGMALPEIGAAEIDDGGCGGGTLMYFSLRRPLYTFCDIRNMSDNPIRVTALMANRFSKSGVCPRRFASYDSNLEVISVSPILLQPQENLIVPTSVLLSPIYIDDLRMDWSTYESISDERGQSFGLRMSDTPENLDGGRSDYYQIGPSLDIRGFELASASTSTIVDVHGFDPNQCYLWHRAWHVGSCPHVYFQEENGNWHYWGDVLGNGWQRFTSDQFVVPENVLLIRIVEVEYETTTLHSVRIDRVEQLKEPIRLNRGDYLDFFVQAGDQVHVQGLYDCAISRPKCPLHLRQKRSLLASYAGSLVDSDDFHSSPKPLARSLKTAF